MGAASSKSSSAPDVSLDRSSLSKLEEKIASAKPDSVSSPDAPHAPSSARQSEMDASIRAKITSELAALRKQEAEVRAQIAAALDKESARVEDPKNGAAKKSKTDKGQSAPLLKQELEAVRRKIETHRQRREKVDQTESVKKAREKALECYREHADTPLECAAAVQEFKRSVAIAEKEFVASLAA